MDDTLLRSGMRRCWCHRRFCGRDRGRTRCIVYHYWSITGTRSWAALAEFVSGLRARPRCTIPKEHELLGSQGGCDRRPFSTGSWTVNVYTTTWRAENAASTTAARMSGHTNDWDCRFLFSSRRALGRGGQGTEDVIFPQS